MKKLIYAAFFTFIFAITIISCKKDSSLLNIDNLKSDKWKITYIKLNNTDVTTDFITYEFKFKDTDVVTIYNTSSSTVDGIYKVNTTVNPETVTFAIGSDATLMKLNKVWNVVEATTTQIKFQNKDNSNDVVTFQKV